MNQKQPEAPPPFSVKLILAETIAYGVVNKSYLYDAIKYPCLAWLVTIFFYSFKIASFDLKLLVITLIQFYLYTLIAVKCHRQFLLNELAITFKDAFIWDKRNTRFIIKGLVLSFVLVLVVFPMAIISAILGQQPVANGFGGAIYIQAAMIPLGYISARLSLVFPAIATDKEGDFYTAWKISKGNGWSLFFLIYLLPLASNLILGNIFGGHVVLRLIYSVIGILVFVFEVLILSNSYRHLSRIHSAD